MPALITRKKAVLVGISYATNENLQQNDFPVQPGAHKDVWELKRLLTSTSVIYAVHVIAFDWDVLIEGLACRSFPLERR